MDLFSELGVKVVSGQRFQSWQVIWEIVKAERNTYAAGPELGTSLWKPSQKAICMQRSNEVTAV